MSINCLHVHVVCINCDMKNGHCHCFDGGVWFCQDCNKMEWETKLEDSVTSRKESLSYISEDHQRRSVKNG